MSRRHTCGVKKWKLDHPIFGEQRRDFFAIGYHGKKFQQKCPGIAHRMSHLGLRE
jgi:hypothetical protein